MFADSSVTVRWNFWFTGKMFNAHYFQKLCGSLQGYNKALKVIIKH